VYSALWDLWIGSSLSGKLLPVMTRFQTMLAEALLSHNRLGTLRQSWDMYKAVSKLHNQSVYIHQAPIGMKGCVCVTGFDVCGQVLPPFKPVE
jgi:hypothetical protein